MSAHKSSRMKFTLFLFPPPISNCIAFKSIININGSIHVSLCTSATHEHTQIKQFSARKQKQQQTTMFTSTVFNLISERISHICDKHLNEHFILEYSDNDL